ncbi:hypothetical protein HTZ84_18170 [Haloterrigena sp. SYSU A558-1]|uniref:Uncharacterized protein n=2 Tax=Haloterrigena gelatinilytica TaxID=2741724 RepID=A0A8J8KGF5_9EURY|nr:hypothetical protein [Haloterrigena gelatinilytica]NUB89969.1 hypothetical protein [Haloterrigena gelatinilytica]NUC74206.1 hypothetical protein [Haloterrigena gelatinilytica]
MSMTDETPGYTVLIQAAIDREKDILGPADAIECADSVDGLVVDGDGTVVDVERDGRAVLGDLVGAYVATAGDVAAFLIARRLENMCDREEVDLPENLAKHM